jgi:hypothetical protein
LNEVAKEIASALKLKASKGHRERRTELEI